MDSQGKMAACLIAVAAAMLMMGGTRASDPNPVQDVCVGDISKGLVINGFPCKNATQLTADDFVFTGLRTTPLNTANPYKANAVFGSVRQFPGLNGEGLGIARLDYDLGGIIPPHSHPRASELLYLLTGRLYVGFITSPGHLYANEISAGDVAIFPRGLLHFQLNIGPGPATAIVSQNGQSSGFQTSAESLFGSGVRDDVLTKAFLLSNGQVDTLQNIFTGFQSRYNVTV